jgi:tetratricopeptide (TPR) repeat protein
MSNLSRILIAGAVSFGAALAAFLVLRGPEPAKPVATAEAALAGARAPQDTDARIARLQADVKAAPRAIAARVELSSAYLQKARETGDPGFYTRADGLLRAVLAERPNEPSALVASAGLALSRHDFRGGLALARRARTLRPAALAPYPALVDAHVELGRFGSAERLLQRMVDEKPTVASYARVSYLRELHGDLDGAVTAMRRAVAAGGASGEGVASVQALLGGLELACGRPQAALRAQRAALAAVPRYPAAEAGLARIAAARGDLDGAITRWRALVARLPLPEYVTGFGEAELAAGRIAAGHRDLALIGAEQRLLAAARVDTDAELAVNQADHGSPRRAVALARRAWDAAPGLRGADALGWALTRSGRPAAGLRWAGRALALGSRDALFRYHAGVAALAAGRTAEGRAQLRTALAHGLAGWPWQAARARALLAQEDVT